MASWLTEYMDALAARDAVEKSEYGIIESYTRLADRVATLQSPTSTRTPDPAAEPLRSSSPSPWTRFGARGKDVAAPADVSDATLVQLRADLASTQRTRAELEARLEPLTQELATLKAAAARDERRIEELSRERIMLERRLQDRNMELKAKAKLVEDVQDEMLSLNLHLNVAEEQAKKLAAENKELVDRWMAHKRQEADAMNERSKWT